MTMNFKTCKNNILASDLVWNYVSCNVYLENRLTEIADTKINEAMRTFCEKVEKTHNSALTWNSTSAQPQHKSVKEAPNKTKSQLQPDVTDTLDTQKPQKLGKWKSFPPEGSCDQHFANMRTTNIVPKS